MFAVGQLSTVMNGEHTTASNTYHLLDSIRVGNHSLHFVDPATSVHTQHAKSYWNRVKKWMKGVHENMLPSYLDEFMWWERHGSTASTALASLCRDIALRYLV